MILVNMDSVTEHDKNKIIEFNNTFSTYTKNYTLLVVYHIKNKPTQHHEFTHSGNIDFLELHTLSASKGVEFTNSSDNEYLNNIINTTYKFSLENWDAETYELNYLNDGETLFGRPWPNTTM